jgi:hypothetical protein
LRAPGNLRARLGALLKIRAPDLSNPSKPTEKELTSAKNWKDSDAAKQRSPGLCRDKAEARRIDLTLQYPTLLMLMADAKPFWSALFHSLTLTDREDYEYRRGSIYKNINAMYRIKDEG